MDPLSTCLLFEQVLAQRRYLWNVTPSTIEWYERSKALQNALGTDVPPLTKSSLQQVTGSCLHPLDWPFPTEGRQLPQLITIQWPPRW